MSEKAAPEMAHRLPKTVVPSHYRIYIDASRVEEYLFQGHVDIDVEIQSTIAELLINSVDLKLTKIEYQASNSSSILTGTAKLDDEYEQATIDFQQPIQPGHGRLRIEFNGTIEDELHGFYRTKDNNQIGACTQFEPDYARRAFPCFDEPSFKAQFTITIRAPSRLVTLCNTPAKAQRNDTENTCVYEFETTPIMSTYLVAYVIGAYEYLETRDANNVLIRVYTAIGEKERGRFALNTIAKILPFYAEYFGIKYPLSKVDYIAIADYGSGAMENWGLITSHETYLLVDPVNTTQETKQEVAFIIAHELAHQWFGNLVTMEWWNDLWLNEGFATWIQFLAVDHVYPEFDVWTQFVCDNLAMCMIPDALHNSHPIEMPIRKASEISEIFDDITYEKGSSVIRLLHSFIGDGAFRTGLANYLAEYAYKNTITENLWSHLSQSAKRPNLSEVLSTWTKQMGFPLLTVTQEQKGNDRLLTIEQSRFFADGSAGDQSTWKIPINICTKSNPNEAVHQLFLNGERKQEFLLEKISETDWIKLNLFSVGIYRVHYPQSMLDALIPGIQDQSLSPQDRFNIQTDLYALARSNHTSYVDYLKLLRQAYKYEDNLTVWKSILRQLTDLNSIFDYATLPTTKALFQKYICDLLSHLYNKLDWEPLPNEGIQNAMLRGLVLIRMGVSGHKKTADEAHRRFEKLIPDPTHSSINPNVRSAIYLTVAQTGNQQTFEQLKTLYRQADSQEESIRLLQALCRFNDERLQRQALDFIWNQEEVRKQDHLTGFLALAGHNQNGCVLAWNYMQENWAKIEGIYGESDMHLIHFVEHTPSHFVSDERAEEVRKFARDHPNPLLERPIKKVLEEIQIRKRVLEHHERNIHDFLSS